MKKFTKITLIIVAVIAAVGILLCGIGAAMAGGWSAMRERMRSGEFNAGGWHFDDGFYFDAAEWWNDDWDDDDWDYEVAETAEGTETAAAVSGAEDAVDSFELAYIQKIDMQIDVADVMFVPADDSDTVTVTLTDGKTKYYSCQMNGSTLKIVYDTHNHHSNLKGPDITVAIPEGAVLSELDIEIGVGDITSKISSLNCDKTDIENGVGDMTLNSLTLSGKLEISTGTGGIELNGGSYEKVELETGVGDVKLSGSFAGNVKVSTGCGDVSFDSLGKESDYNYKLSCGMGDIRFNDESYSGLGGEKKITNAGSDITIDLESGIGDIKVKTN